MHRKVSILTQSKETQPKHEDQTTVEHYYTFFSFFSVSSFSLCWGNSSPGDEPSNFTFVPDEAAALYH